MAFMRGDLLQRVAKLVKGGAMEKPKWFDAVLKVPPHPKQLRSKQPPKIVLPEDPLIESYYARHPEAKTEPFRLQSFDAPVARRFALRQLELMQSGIPKRQSRDIVEEEFEAEEERREEEVARLRRQALREGRTLPEGGFGGMSAIEEVQREEREYIRKGLEDLARKKAAGGRA